MALSAGAIAGIVAAGVVGLVLLGFIYAYFRMRDQGSGALMQQLAMQNMAAQSAPPIYLPEPGPVDYPPLDDGPYIDEERITPGLSHHLVRRYEEERPRTPPPRARDPSPSRIVVELDDEPQEILRVTRQRRSSDPNDTIAARQRREDRERNRSWKLIHRVVHGGKKNGKKRAMDDCELEQKKAPEVQCEICWENGERSRCGHHQQTRSCNHAPSCPSRLQHYDLAVQQPPCRVHNVCRAYKASNSRHNRVQCTSCDNRVSRNTTGGMMVDYRPNNDVENSMDEQEQAITLTEDF